MGVGLDGNPRCLQSSSPAGHALVQRQIQAVLSTAILFQLIVYSNGEPGKNTTACPANGSGLTADATCTCKEPLESWTGTACCVRNAHWNGTACECNKNHQLEGGLCCHIDDHKGWDKDRCGCYNGSYWNGNSCLPGEVTCPPNALWNGTCYCKEANWASETHRDVMVNGACCPENAYYKWIVTGQVVNPFIGECLCLDGFPWNGTACVPLNRATGWSKHKKLGVGIGGGMGLALLLAGCVAVAILTCKACRIKAVSPRPPHPLMLPAKPASFSSRKNEADHPAQGPDKKLDTPHKWGASHERNGVPADPDASWGTLVNSTALDLLKERRTSGKDGEQPSFAHPDLDAGGSLSHGHSGKTDSARTYHSIYAGRQASKKDGQMPTNLRLDVLSTGSLEKADPGKDNKLGEDSHREELWTHGVNPAEVDILQDTLGQPLVVGRGAFAVVYLGRWQATLVAVKVMLATDSEAAQQEVQAEADILRGLRHPNIVLLMAVCVSPGQQMMVILEYCGGGNLHKALQKDARSVQRRLVRPSIGTPPP